MRVGSHHEADAPVEVVREGDLLARGLGVDVHHDRVARLTERTGLDFPVHAREGVVHGVHEDAAHHVHDQHAASIRDLDQGGAAPRRALRVVERAQQARLPLDEHQGLALVEGMVAERDHVGAGFQDGGADGFRDARAARRVLAVDHHAVETPRGPQPWQLALDRVAAGAAHDIADEQEPHGVRFRRAGCRGPSRRGREARRGARPG